MRWQGRCSRSIRRRTTFDVLADDGVKLWVNGQLLIDGWPTSPPTGSPASPSRPGCSTTSRWSTTRAPAATRCTSTGTATASRNRSSPPRGSTRWRPRPRRPPSPARRRPWVRRTSRSPSTSRRVISGGSPATFALGAGSGPLPPGLTLNATTGLISGTPTTAGDYQVALTATNTVGTGASVLDIQILNPGSGVTRELWNNLPDATSPPCRSPPRPTASTRPSPRWRTTPHLRPQHRRAAARLFHRARHGQLPLLARRQQQRRTLDLRRRGTRQPRPPRVGPPPAPARKAGTTRARPTSVRPGSPWSPGRVIITRCCTTRAARPRRATSRSAWLQDPTGHRRQAPRPASAVVPGYVLTKYDYPTATAAAGTLYVTNLSPQGTSVSSATGSANLRMLPGNTQAILHFNYGGLSSPRTAYHLHIAPDQTGSGPIVFDLDDVDKFHPELKTADGGYIWNIVDAARTPPRRSSAPSRTARSISTSTRSTSQRRDSRLPHAVNGSQTPPGTWPIPVTRTTAARRRGGAFPQPGRLRRGPGGPGRRAEAAGTPRGSTTRCAARHPPPARRAGAARRRDEHEPLRHSVDNAWWRASVNAPDQLRQRVAFALSEILVVSDTNATLGNSPRRSPPTTTCSRTTPSATSATCSKPPRFTRRWVTGSTCRATRRATSPPATIPTRTMPARSCSFSPSGSTACGPTDRLVLDSSGNLVPTYDQDTITNGFARVFTGWTWHQALQASGQLPTSFYPATDWLDPMVMVKNYHELGTKTLLDNVVLPPPLATASPGAVTAVRRRTRPPPPTTPIATPTSKRVGQHLLPPERGPVRLPPVDPAARREQPQPGLPLPRRAKFNDDGTSAHVRGNMAAVVNAILLDGEARNPSPRAPPRRANSASRCCASPRRRARSSPREQRHLQPVGHGGDDDHDRDPHHFSAGDNVWLDFSVNDTGTPPVAPANNPTTGAYTVLSSPAPTATTFAVNAASLASVPVPRRRARTTLTVNTSGPAVGEKVYLKFLTGGFADGVYTVASVPTTSSFTVSVATRRAPRPSRAPSSCRRAARYDNIVNPTAARPPARSPSPPTPTRTSTSGDHVWVVGGSSSQLKDAEWIVASVVDERHFTVTTTAALHGRKQHRRDALSARRRRRSRARAT